MDFACETVRNCFNDKATDASSTVWMQMFLVCKFVMHCEMCRVTTQNITEVLSTNFQNVEWTNTWMKFILCMDVLFFHLSCTLKCFRLLFKIQCNLFWHSHTVAWKRTSCVHQNVQVCEYKCFYWLDFTTLNVVVHLYKNKWFEWHKTDHWQCNVLLVCKLYFTCHNEVEISQFLGLNCKILMKDVFHLSTTEKCYMAQCTI